MHMSPNGKRYIGQTSDTDKRWASGYSTNKDFHRDIEIYGWDNIEHIIVADNLTKAQANIMEHNLIIEYKTILPQYGYNKTFGKNAEGKNWGGKYYKCNMIKWLQSQ